MESPWRNDDCIRTASGVYINVFDPDPDTILIEDIAHALSHVPRWTGHTTHHLSVAHHSVNCASETMYNVNLEHLTLTALLHDASEAYLADIATPIKRHIAKYYEIEDGLMKVIAKKFGFQWPLPEEIKTIDKEQLEFEWEYHVIGDMKPFASTEQVREDFLWIFNKYK